MKLKLPLGLIAGFAMALALLGVVTWVEWRQLGRAERTTAMVTHTHEVLIHLSRLLSLLQDVENGARGFVITGERAFLEPFETARKRVDGEFGSLRALTSDNPRQRAHCDALAPLLAERIAAAQIAVDLRRDSGFEAARQMVAGGRGESLMDDIRAVIARMDAAEQALLEERSANARREASVTNLLSISGGALAFALLIGTFAIVLRGKQLQLRSQAQLDRFFTLSLDMLGIAGMDGYFKRLSPAFSQTLGYTTEELLARPFLDFVHPDDRAATLAEMDKLRQGMPTIRFENRYRSQNGSWRWLSWKAQPILEEGQLYVTARDISQRKQSEETLRENEQRLSLALESGKMGAWELDLVQDTAIRTLKHDQIFGYQSLQPQWGAEIFMGHVVPEDREVVRKAFDDALANDRLQFECRILWQDQSLHWIAADGTVYRDRDGVPKRILGVVMDITTRKQAEEQIARFNSDLHAKAVELAEVNKELEAFSYSVSHDLRAPLRSIDGFSQVLLEDCAEHLNEEGQDALQRVRRAATTMGELIDALLALSRVSRVQLQTKRVDVSALATAIADELRQSQPDRQVEFIVAPDLVVDGDRTLLRVALANLLGNAWKYTQPRARARIELASLEKEREIIYFVRDNGVGFDMTYVGKLFGAFQRLHRQTEFAGTGIGLATVQRIVRRHGGRAWAEGAVNEGATFYFTLHGAAKNNRAAWEKAEASAGVA